MPSLDLVTMLLLISMKIKSFSLCQQLRSMYVCIALCQRLDFYSCLHPQEELVLLSSSTACAFSTTVSIRTWTECQEMCY